MYTFINSQKYGLFSYWGNLNSLCKLCGQLLNVYVVKAWFWGDIRRIILRFGLSEKTSFMPFVTSEQKREREWN